MRFILSPPDSARPAVIVETRATITPQQEENLKAVMYARSCPNGMLLDATRCVVLRDTYDDMGPQSIQVDLRLNTADVLILVQGSSLDDRVATWLALLSASWNNALPMLPDVAPLMQDFVPAAVGTVLHIVGDVQ